MLTPAQQHFQRVMAEHRTANQQPTRHELTAYETVLYRLRMDKAQLKMIQAQSAKAELKRKMLPNYQPWIDGTLAADTGQADDVITTAMIWSCDCGDIAGALRIGEYVLRHKLPMPDQYQRTAATVLVEEICDPLLAAFKAKPTTAPVAADLLEGLKGLTQNADMPDQVRAKLFKCLGYTLRVQNTPEAMEKAIDYLRQATLLNPKKAGVTRDIELLQRALNKTAQTDSPPPPQEKPAEPTAEPTKATVPAEQKAPRQRRAAAQQKTASNTKAPVAKRQASGAKKTTPARKGRAG